MCSKFYPTITTIKKLCSMRKLINLYKRNIAVFAIVLMSINTFATTASNDGSSFVTKAEFDNLMIGFNDRMNEYQAALNAKIDQAVSGYIAGMSAQAVLQLDNYAKLASDSNVNNIKFAAWTTPSESKNVHDINAAYAVAKMAGVGVEYNQNGTGIYSWSGVNNQQAWNGGAATVRYTNYTGNTDNYTSAYYFAKFPWKDDNNTSDFTLNSETDGEKKNLIKRKRLHFDLFASSISFSYSQYTGKSWSAVPMSVSSTITTDYTRLSQPGTFVHDTQGAVGILEKMQPYCIQTHEWSDFKKDTDEDANYFLNYNLSGVITGTDSGVEYGQRDYYSTDSSKAVTLDIQKDKAASGNDQSKSGMSNTIRYQNQLVSSKRGVDSGSNNVKFNFKYNRQSIYTLNWNRLTTEFFNNLLGDKVYKYQGLPVTRTSKEGTITFTLTLNNPDPGTYTYCLADCPFKNEAIPEHMYETIGGKQYDHVLKRGAVSRSGDEVIEISLDKGKVYDTKKGDVIYLKVEPSVVGEVVTARFSEKIQQKLN